MNFQSELETLIRARYPILYVISNEEMRAQQLVLEIARKRQKKVFEWSCSMGMMPAGASIQSQKSRNPATRDPLNALDQVIELVEPAIFILKDFHPFLSKSNFAVIRKLKEIALHLKNSFKTLRKKIYADVDGMKKPAAGRRWQRVRYHVCHGRRWWLTLHRHRIWEE